jgi:predicted phosphodiesterase
MQKHYNIKKIKENDYENIYVVGDIHGMFDLLEEELIKVNFDKKKDLLIATGDLIDRGEQSIKATKYVEKKWFVSVFGNHDYKFMNLPNRGYSDLFPPLEYFDKTLKEKDVIKFEKSFSKYLYGAIQVTLNNDEKIGIVHAGISLGESWTNFITRLYYGDYYTVECAIWDRPIAKLRLIKERLDNNNINEIQYYQFIERNRLNVSIPELNDRSYHFFNDIYKLYEQHSQINDLKALITGHNIVSREGNILSIANRYFIDTGAFLTEPYFNKKGEIINPIKDNKYKLTVKNINYFK